MEISVYKASLYYSNVSFSLSSMGINTGLSKDFSSLAS